MQRFPVKSIDSRWIETAPMETQVFPSCQRKKCMGLAYQTLQKFHVISRTIFSRDKHIVTVKKVLRLWNVLAVCTI